MLVGSAAGRHRAGHGSGLEGRENPGLETPRSPGYELQGFQFRKSLFGSKSVAQYLRARSEIPPTHFPGGGGWHSVTFLATI